MIDLAPYKVNWDGWKQVFERVGGGSDVICRICWGRFPAAWVTTESLTMHFSWHQQWVVAQLQETIYSGGTE